MLPCGPTTRELSGSQHSSRATERVLHSRAARRIIRGDVLTSLGLSASTNWEKGLQYGMLARVFLEEALSIREARASTVIRFIHC